MNRVIKYEERSTSLRLYRKASLIGIPAANLSWPFSTEKKGEITLTLGRPDDLREGEEKQERISLSRSIDPRYRSEFCVFQFSFTQGRTDRRICSGFLTCDLAHFLSSPAHVLRPVLIKSGRDTRSGKP